MGVFYPNGSKSPLIGYADVGYLSDTHKARSQIGNLFSSGNSVLYHGDQ